MDTGSSQGVLRQIRTLYTLGALGRLTDAQLLELFLTRQGEDAEDAFAALVDRHGPMVLGVCRRMLSRSHDAEDAFQAAFLILARRAAAIGRRERLASWLYGVAVRTASEARRRTARQRGRELPLMEVSQVESAPREERDDLIALLDEELNRLPERYRAALVACELEGKSRREAATQLGLPEGTLSTHLARGRKLLRDRLLRRGVSLGVGPIVGLPRFLGVTAVPERLLGATVQAALAYLVRSGFAGTVPAAASSLAERVLKTMWLTRLSLLVASVMAVAAVVVSAVVMGSVAPAGDPPEPVTAQASADDVTGRVVDKAGAGVPRAQVWAVGGTWSERETVATITTDDQGRFFLPGVRSQPAAKIASGRGGFGLFARARDGRVGWADVVGRKTVSGRPVEVELRPSGEVRGRVVDQEGRPIVGAAVATFQISSGGGREPGNYFNLSPEAAAPYQTTTAADGSFVLTGIPHGAGVQATIHARGFLSPRVLWDSAQVPTITLDNRVGQIKGKLIAPDPRGLSGQLSVYMQCSRSAGKSAPSRVSLHYNAGTKAGKDGSFHFDGVPPGRYAISAAALQDAPFVARPVDAVEVSPNAIVNVDIPLVRLVTITGRVVDPQTGKGIAGIPVGCYRLDNNSLEDLRAVTTDADGRYSVAAQPGVVTIHPEGLPKTYLIPSYAECPRLEVKADQSWPDLKLGRARELDGIVVDQSGHPAAGAEVYLLAADRPGVRQNEPARTGPDGAFHFDQLDPDDMLSLWARSGDATTDGTVVIRPREVKGKLTLTAAPKFAARIRGMAVDGSGQRIARATATLWWNRPYASEKGQMKGMSTSSVLASYITSENGLFVFRNLWPGLMYHVVIEARGQNKAEAPRLTARAGETHDVGKIVLINTSGFLAGQVVGTDGRPIGGAAVFNLGDGPERAAAATDQNGRFRLEGLFPGVKYAFARTEGYRDGGTRAEGAPQPLGNEKLAPARPSNLLARSTT